MQPRSLGKVRFSGHRPQVTLYSVNPDAGNVRTKGIQQSKPNQLKIQLRHKLTSSEATTVKGIQLSEIVCETVGGDVRSFAGDDLDDAQFYK